MYTQGDIDISGGTVKIRKQLSTDKSFYITDSYNNDIFLVSGSGDSFLSGSIGIGTHDTDYKVNIEDTNPELLKITADQTYAMFKFYSYRDSASTHCLFSGKAARGSKASPVKLDEDDLAFSIRAGAYDGSSFPGNIAVINFEVDGTINTSDTPGRIILSTTPAGSTTESPALKVDSNQDTTLYGHLKGGGYIYPNYSSSNTVYLQTNSVGSGDDRLHYHADTYHSLRLGGVEKFVVGINDVYCASNVDLGVQAGQRLNLEGASGDTYIKFNSTDNAIEFYINGTHVASIESDGSYTDEV